MGFIMSRMTRIIFSCRSELAHQEKSPVREQARSYRMGGESGFTLIELITVILLLGIIGVMGSELITTSFKGFAETDATMELYEEGKLALMRMEREVHHMVPNAIDTSSTTTINFGVIDANALSANNLAGQYQTVGTTTKVRDLSTNTLPLNSYISIYNTRWPDFSSTSNRKVYQITQIVGNNMGLGTVVIGSHSATKRYYPVQGVVRYAYDNTSGIVSRSQATVTTSNDLTAALDSATAYPLLTNIQPGSLSFTYTPASLTRNAMVRVNFSLERNGISLDFHKEIQVRNVP